MGKLFQEEVLFNEDPNRLVILPIKHPNLWSYYKKLQGTSWTAEEINFNDDIRQLRDGQVSPKIMRVVDHVLGFFSGADKIVNDNLSENTMNEIKVLEAQYFYGQQIQNENVHSETYALTIDTYYADNPAHKDKVLRAVESMPCVRKLYDWCRKWIARTPDIEKAENPILKEYAELGADDEVIDDLASIWCKAKRIIAFACIEGIMFSASFCFIFWLKEQGLLPGLTFSNELISPDEGLHRDYGCETYKMIVHAPPSEQIVEIVRDATDFMNDFVNEMLIEPLVNMNATLMMQYVEFTADNLLCQAGFPKYFNATNCFPFMEKISFNGQTNFFERRVGEYSLSGFEKNDQNDDLVLDDEY